MFESGGTRKTGLTGGLSREPHARVWRGIRPGISAVLTGLLALFLFDLLSRSQFPPPRTLTIFMKISTNYKFHIFQKVRRYIPIRPPWPPRCLRIKCARKLAFLFTFTKSYSRFFPNLHLKLNLRESYTRVLRYGSNSDFE